ncbi:sarcosine oxidase subunit beta family protein [Alphaproteobacteria bacterium]|jgi:sarcosine oxidase subunit beta|nr:sarcosine oxidase subunit beta family protein [Alphaproteobacteria bacterium]GIR67914.1 MAG: sarcosine oxidase subunit beta [Pelagibacteraceae bacterium]|tara:strand:+ start:5112 stop:6368 length:1257 start_codon:yes stop_codon:yes gene_type:complete
MQKYSVFSLVKNAFTNHENWEVAWKDPEPKKEYDVIIVGGGGHGLATAYYLAKEHGITNVAILEKGWIGGGNVGRNTTILRSNYMFDSNAHFYEFGMKLWETLSQELNYNVMYSPRGIINLAHSDAQMNAYARRGNSMRLNGIDAILLGRDDLKKMIPFADFSETCRFPIHGGLMQPRGGTARHDAVAWGYARQADSMGVDIIQNCEVTGFDVNNGKIEGVQTSRGNIKTKKVGLCVAGSTTLLADMLNMRLPIEAHVLQACVSEPVKPLLHNVVTFGAGHFYCSQSDKGEMVMGGDLDGYNSYAQRGNMPMIQHVLTGGLAVFPNFSRLKMLRTWGGIMDMSMDGSPIIDKTHIEGVYLNCGWCYGGFKATPSSGFVFAHTIAQDQVHELNSDFNLERFHTGKIIDEKGVGPKPWIG